MDTSSVAALGADLVLPAWSWLAARPIPVFLSLLALSIGLAVSEMRYRHFFSGQIGVAGVLFIAACGFWMAATGGVEKILDSLASTGFGVAVIAPIVAWIYLSNR